MEKLISKGSVLEVAKGFTFTDKVEEKKYMDFLIYCLDNVETLEPDKKFSTDKEKLLRLLEVMDKKSSFEEIVLNYMEANKKDFCAYRYTDLIQEITKYFLVPEIVSLENVKAISKERALYLKTYLEGDMYTTKEAAIEAIPIQIKNAQTIIDFCNGKEMF